MRTTHGYEKQGPCTGEKWNGDAYIMPDWAGRMAVGMEMPT